MINAFNNKFSQICSDISFQKKMFVLGLSGGIDSMALLHLLNNFVKIYRKFQIQILPVIIDHGLRENSSLEAFKVKKIAENLGFHTIIKKISEKKPNGNIQNWARKQRRKLLVEIAFENSATLILGHHADDQVETFFMRSLKGSGIGGLVCMSYMSYWHGILVIRPLINFKKNQIKNFVKKNNVEYFEDKSNISVKFERVKTRYILKKNKSHFWPTISDDILKYNNLNKLLVKKISSAFISWTKENILIDETGSIRIKTEDLKSLYVKSKMFSVTVVGKVLQTVGGSDYPPKKKKTLFLLNNIFKYKNKSFTLGNVKIFFNKDYFFFIRENRNICFDMEIKKDKYYLFDGKFILVSQLSGFLIKPKQEEIHYIGYSNYFKKYKKLTYSTIPFLKTLEGLSIKPHLNIIDVKSDLRNIAKNNLFDLYLINRTII